MNDKGLNELDEYFKTKYYGQDIRVVPGHWPDFKTKEEIDKWIEELSEMTGLVEYLLKKKGK